MTEQASKIHFDYAHCTGCAACYTVCPQKAIEMKSMQYGFLYPVIDRSKCIGCGACLRACPIDKPVVATAKKVFAAISKDKDLLMASSSGGVFGTLANGILAEGGVVCGCIFDEKFKAVHAVARTKAELKKMFGSKYVQSEIGDTLADIKKYLLEGKKVLFSGTPCQIAGLYGALGKEYDNLLTVEIICHGVPSPGFFAAYLKYLERKKGKLVQYSFRDKEKIAGCNGTYTVLRGIFRRKHRITPQNDFYYHYFMYARNYRTSCYTCKYANAARTGDITIGDYWGVEKVIPEICKDNGVSVVIANSDKGMRHLNKVSASLQLVASTFADAARENPQLARPAEEESKDYTVYEQWKKAGISAVAERFRHANKVASLKSSIKMGMPNTLYRFMRKVKHLVTGGTRTKQK